MTCFVLPPRNSERSEEKAKPCCDRLGNAAGLNTSEVVRAYSDLLLTSVLNGRGLKVILEKRPRSAKSNFF